VKEPLINVFTMMCHEEKNFLEMKVTIKSEIDEENVNEYINRYLKSRNLKNIDFISFP
ncbi:unnamed protein product, partial [marine sediment metagenome]